jgi:hypothetical protein
MRYLRVWLGLIGLTLVGIAQAVEVYFWGTSESPPPGVVVDGHPCGSVVILDVNQIPPDSAWLRADRVREVDASGNVLRAWRVPADHYPVGVEGDTLILAFGSYPDSTLWVATSGAVAKGPSPKQIALEHRACPASVGDGYACAVISQSPVKLLAYAPICS